MEVSVFYFTRILASTFLGDKHSENTGRKKLTVTQRVSAETVLAVLCSILVCGVWMFFIVEYNRGPTRVQYFLYITICLQAPVICGKLIF